MVDGLNDESSKGYREGGARLFRLHEIFIKTVRKNSHKAMLKASEINF
jgi:hypothetical protein